MFFVEKAPTQEPGVGASPLEGATTGRKSPQDAVSSVVEQPQEDTPFPPGVVGWIAQALLDRAARPVSELALATAIGIVAGVIGRAYNASGLGLNLYILMLASTGTGKDIASDGRDAMFNAIAKAVPSSADFRGAGELPSAAGVIRMFHDAKNPAKLSVLGEFGVKLKEMADPRANANLAGLGNCSRGWQRGVAAGAAI